MSKKLLSEAQVRRFAKLANLSPVNEMYDKRDDEEPMEEGAYGMHKRDEEEPMQEDAAEEVAMDAAEEAPEEMGAEIEAEGGADLELDADAVQKIADALPALQMIADAADGGEPEGMDMDEPEGMDMDEPEGMDMDEPEALDEEVDEIMEALQGIEYIPGKQEVVNEVARRVAKRLLKAKQAEKNLQEALGNRSRRTK